MSQESVKVWSLASGECIHELTSSGNMFHSCVFHPSYSTLLVIGGYQVYLCTMLYVFPFRSFYCFICLYIYIYICFLYNNLCVFTIVGQQCKYNSTTCTYFIIIIHVTLLIKKNVGYRGNFFWGYQAVRTKLKGIKLC